MIILLLNYPKDQDLPPGGVRMPTWFPGDGPQWELSTAWIQEQSMEAREANKVVYVCTHLKVATLPSPTIAHEARIVLEVHKMDLPFILAEVYPAGFRNEEELVAETLERR